MNNRKHLTDQEYQGFKAYLQEHKHILLELLLRTGMRQGEAVELTEKNLTGDCITFQTDKRGKIRRVPVDAEFMGRLRESLARVAKSGDLVAKASHDSQCRMLRMEFERVARRYFGPMHRLSLHSLRHTFAVRMLRALNNDVLKVQQIMGHKDINATIAYLRYVQVDDYKDKILEAV